MRSSPARSARPAALADARLYLCVDRRQRQGDLAEFLDAVLPAGVDVVQLREKSLEAREELAALEVVADAAARHGVLWSVNDRADLAVLSGAPVIHVGQGDLAVDDVRRVVSPDTIVGLSTHDRDQVTAAIDLPGLDYFCVGPVWSTPTKPGRPAAGLDLLDLATRLAPPDDPAAKPWFAIGGIDLATIDEVVARGARRVVVVRAITEADDPAAAAAALARRLRAHDVSSGRTRQK
jgi:thiamine-phosphate pyrophosphorylase